MTSYIKTFKELNKGDAAIAGGKGASLGEMTQIKLPVPPGFVVLASAFDRFLEETDLAQEIEAQMKKINYEEMHSVAKASEVIRELIRKKSMPDDIGKEIMQEFFKLDMPHVAVRSSATAEDSSYASWAGELESYLDVTFSNLLESVKKCWSSLFTPRAIFYRYEKKIHREKVSVAVVLQKMVESEVSGICFTVHPVTEDKHQMVIEAGLGLGEAIVGGMITPDTYVINKKTGNIEDKNISQQEIMIKRGKEKPQKVSVPESHREKQKLKDRDILKLARLCMDIEKHYKKPQDIEWALEKNKLYIVQSRPITTL
jgi:pyruvate, water dikinase